MDTTFISYSRRDAAFVHRLHAELTGQGRDVWVDWEDIPATSDWRFELSEGIEAATAFVFVMSPDSLVSHECAVELERATGLNKRIVPLVLRDPDGAPVPDALASRNWIFFREGDDFDASLATLVAALDTDLEWAREHTRLLVAADEWEKAGRARSRLLGGTDLTEAEALMAQAAGRSPEPTALQLEYVATSRTEAVRRQRRRMSFVTAGLLVALVLAVVAIVEWRSAVDQKHQAESDKLAAEAVGQLNADPELATLLAVQAVHSADQPSAEQALRRAVGAIQVVRVLRGHRGPVARVAFSPDGRLLASSGADHTVRLWRLDGGGPPRVLHGGGASVVDLSFTPDGRLLLSAARDGTLRLWSTADGSEVPGGEVDNIDPIYAPLSADGRTALAADHASGVRTVHVSAAGGLQLGEVLPGQHLRRWGHVEDLVYSADGSHIAALYRTGLVLVWSAAPARRIAVIRAPAAPSAGYVALSPDGSRVAAASSDADRTVLATAGGRTIRTLRSGISKISAIAFSPDGRRLATADADGVGRIYDARDGSLVALLRGHLDSIDDIRFSPDSRFVVTGSDDGTARVWVAATGAPASILSASQGAVLATGFSPDGTLVATGSADGSVRLWRAGPGRVRLALTEPGLTYAALSPDGRWAASDGARGPELWNVASGRSTALTADYPRADQQLAFSPDGRSLAYATENGLLPPHNRTAVRIADVATGRTLPAILRGSSRSSQSSDSIQALDYSPDGRRLLVGQNDGAAFLWDPRTGSTATLGSHGTSAVTAARFAPRGGPLAVGRADGTVALFDPRTGAPRRVLEAGSSGIVTVAFSPDGRLLATVGDGDDAALLWDARSGRRLASMPHLKQVIDVAFSHGGGEIVTSSFDDTARIWSLRTAGASVRPVLRVTLKGHGNIVESARFSPDDRFVVTASADGTSRVWDAASGTPLATLGSGLGTVDSADFAGGGRSILTLEGGVHQADVYRCDVCGSLDDLLATASRLVTRPLTPAERARYLNGT